MTTPLTVTFLGAAQTVTGSKHLLGYGERRYLVDAGLFQGEKALRERNWEPFPIDAATLTAVLITHGHADHVAYLPALVRAGFSGPIYATAETIDLAEIILRDSAKLQELATEDAVAGGYSKHASPRPLYDTADVEETLPLFRMVEFDADVDLGDGLSARWTRAGHILGSASVRVASPDASVLVSGDIGRHDHPILRPRAIPQGADAVLVETTYGDREHPEPAVAHTALADAITGAVGRGGVVVIPAFAIDRTETVLAALVAMHRAGRIPDVPVYVDGPMALAALDVYRQHTDELADGVGVDDFTDLPRLVEARTSAESRQINKVRKPCIIISSSGMAEGGRVLSHLARRLPDARNAVVLVGYQAEGTRGRALLEGAKAIKINGQYVPVKAHIVRDDEFSVHADASDLIDWLAALQPAPDTVYLVHGEAGVMPVFAQRVERELGLSVVVPRPGEVIRAGRQPAQT